MLFGVEMLYDDYVPRLAQRFAAELESIRVGYNFDLGDEFEIAMCRVLRLILPTKFGVCRGFVVSKDGDQAGDDLIIFDWERFSSLGLRDPDDYSRNEFIPVEAVFAYIETKYTLNLEGGDGQSLSKSISQVQAVKELCYQREPLQPGELRHITFAQNLKMPDSRPQIRNPAWGAVFSSRVRDRPNGTLLDNHDQMDALLPRIPTNNPNIPDILVLGKHVTGYPVIPDAERNVNIISNFSMVNKTTHVFKQTTDVAAGVGLCFLMSAVDWILLGPLPWARIFGEPLGTKPQ